MKNSPRVAIGLPVYNGENYLRNALDAILAQTYTDFELIISDNASTDRTQEICLAYAARDARIRYERAAVNLGAAKNFNRVFDLADSEYFMWAAHDDMMAPELLARCVEVLDRDASVILCHVQIKIIDDEGDVLTAYDDALKLHNVADERAYKRFRDLIMIPHYCFDSYGLIRSRVLTMRPIFEGHVSSDRNTLAELGLIGKFHHVPEYLFFARDHPRRAWPLWKWVEQFDTARVNQIPFPRWSLLWGYIRSVQRVPLPLIEKLRCWLLIAAWVPRNVRGLGKDLVVATMLLSKRGMKWATQIGKSAADYRNHGVKVSEVEGARSE